MQERTRADSPNRTTYQQEGKGRARGGQGRQHDRGDEPEVQRAPEPGDRLTAAVAQTRGRSVRRWRSLSRAGGGPAGGARQDGPANHGERFFGRRAQNGGTADRGAMIDRSHELPIKRQAELPCTSRGAVYCHPEPVSRSDRAPMRRIDELSLKRPFGGSWMLRDMPGRMGIEVSRPHVGTLMRRMDTCALYRRPSTSKQHAAHPVFAYLLRASGIDRADAACALDVTCGSMARGWVHLVAVLDWAGPRALAHRLSFTMETSRCVEALNGAAVRNGAPVIVSSDRCSQFPGVEFVTAVKDCGGRQSMDGRGCRRDRRLRRAAVAQREIRGGLSRGFRPHQRGKSRHHPKLEVLQRASTAPAPLRANAQHVLLRSAGAHGRSRTEV
jgi:putative transposase